ncbi:MAG: hypothetical protein KatS3mg078_0963 [Deltaproteobacteria bacterium]|jgi:hypothetical protein|nr:MAG: hypothetical protein KatS3mg078_0963 [Deltaproteobacteria bacterium]
MSCKDIKGFILEYPNLTPDQIGRVKEHVKDCSDCDLLFKQSKDVWELLDMWEEIEPGDDFILRFWNRVDKERKEGFSLVDLIKSLKIRWIAPIALVLVSLIAFLVFSFFEHSKSVVVITEKDIEDDKILLELENDLSSETLDLLYIYGLWDEKSEGKEG